MKNEIMPFESKENILEEIKKLKIELSMKILERDNLELHEGKAIENAYILTFGELEYKVINAENKFRRLRRKLELIVFKVNREEKVDLKKIDKIIEEEQKEFEEKLREKLDEINSAVDFASSEKMTVEKTKEFKKMYRKIIKVLHPDLNPTIKQEEKELFNKSVEAYEVGNYEAIEMIYHIVETKEDLEENIELEGFNLVEYKEKLKNMLFEVIKEIDIIKTLYPFTLKKILDDEILIELKKHELEEEYQMYLERIKLYEEEIKKNLGEK